MKKFLRFVGILFMGITAAVTLIGGIGTTCVALDATKYESMKAIADYQWLYILYVLVGVALGILGVALIQTLLASLGFLLVCVPGAGLWALLVLILAVVQLPTILILGPIIVYVFSTSSTVAAVVFAIWSILVGISDAFLKPLLMGRGVDVPMLVIFIGAIGGFMTSGIIGLFVGAVILALGYKLFLTWLDKDTQPEGEPSKSE